MHACITHIFNFEIHDHPVTTRLAFLLGFTRDASMRIHTWRCSTKQSSFSYLCFHQSYRGGHYNFTSVNYRARSFTTKWISSRPRRKMAEKSLDIFPSVDTCFADARIFVWVEIFDDETTIYDESRATNELLFSFFPFINNLEHR